MENSYHLHFYETELYKQRMVESKKLCFAMTKKHEEKQTLKNEEWWEVLFLLGV